MIEIPTRKVCDLTADPAYAHSGDAGLDLRSACSLSIKPGERAQVPCGIAMAIPEGFCGLVVPRSGLAARYGITVLNAPGLIDSGYRGEICVILHNTDKEHTFEIENGDRVAQLLILEHPFVKLSIVEELETSERGTDGFGSSGVK